jgi:dihydroorotate dehydrogenase electron transfer subunit
MINKEYFIIYIKNKRIALNSKPGRFFELLPKGDFKGLLRKPISIYSVVDDKVGFMIKNVGYGTNYLSQLKNGDFVDFLGPLGNTFGVVKNQRILLISGGIGFAPLYYLNQELKKNNNSVVWIHGGRSYNDIFDKTLVNYTNDGSYGIKGFVTSDLEKILKEKKIQKVYTCGPKIMMKKVAKITDKLGVETEVSLESYMACGIGVCKGCSVLINENNSQVYKTVCKDGPIFNSKEVVWNE